MGSRRGSCGREAVDRLGGRKEGIVGVEAGFHMAKVRRC